MKIEILGTGSAICKILFSNTLEALRESGRNGKVVVVNDFKKLMKLGIKSTPTLIINGVVILSGKLVSPEEILKLLQQNISSFM